MNTYHYKGITSFLFVSEYCLTTQILPAGWCTDVVWDQTRYSSHVQQDHGLYNSCLGRFCHVSLCLPHVSYICLVVV